MKRYRLTLNEEQKGIKSKRLLFLLIAVAVCMLSFLMINDKASARSAAGESAMTTDKKDDQMKKRVLIVYASRAGSTAEVAKTIERTLKESGVAADALTTADVRNPGEYNAVIVGSAIRMGKWLPEAVDFVKKHHDRLAKVPTAYFVVCNTMKVDTPENRKKTLTYLDPVRTGFGDIQPVDIGLFGGVIDFKKLSFVDRSMLKMKGVAEGDFRDWTAIKKWATDVAPMLLKK